VREKDGQKLELYWPIHDRQSHHMMATFVQGALREVGVIATIEAMDTASVLETRHAGKHDAALFWYSFADPDSLRVVFHSANIGAFNFANYSNPDVDTWLDDASSSADPDARKALYSRVQIKLLEDAVTIPLVDTIVYNAKAKKLQGETLDFLASFVWMNDATFV
jgi:peptide/nickel transport system substrate-binding protein